MADFSGPDGAILAAQTLKVFNVSRNGFDSGPLPDSWRSPTLRVLDVSLNRVPGELPAAWGAPTADGQRSAFPALELLEVQGNTLGGPYDPWAPNGGARAVFAPTYIQLVRPGNALMEFQPEGSPSGYIPSVPSADAPVVTSSSGDSSGGLSAGAIAGIVVGSLAAAALVAALAGYALQRRRAVGTAAPAAGAGSAQVEGKDASARGGWGQNDLEGGVPGGDSAGGSTWSSAGGTAAARSSLRDSAMGSDPSSGSAGEAGEGVQDTDPQRLPSDWATVEWSELELGAVLGHGSFGTVRLAK